MLNKTFFDSFVGLFHTDALLDALDLLVGKIDQMPVRIILSMFSNLGFDPFVVGRKLRLDPSAGYR